MSLRLSTLAIGLTILFTIAGSAQPLTCAPEGVDVVCTDQGAVRGVADGRTLAFKGFLYAQPPVGK